jgi:MFS family permease
MEGVRAPPSYVNYAAAAFCLTFGSYFAVANQLTSLLGLEGFFILASLQAAFVVGTMFGPLVLWYVGDATRVFRFSAFGFCLFNFTLAATISSSSRWALYTFAIICGFGGSWMWVAQGVYVASLFPNAEQGAGFGQFNSIFSINGVWAYILLLVLDQAGVPSQTVMWVFFGTSVVAWAAFFLVQPWKMQVNLKDGAAKERPSTMRRLSSMLRMYRNPTMLKQALAALWAGHTEGMYWSTIAQQYRTPSLIATCFLAQSLVALVTSVAMGKLSDRLGRFICMSICLVVAFVTNVFTGFGVMISETDKERAVLRFILLVGGAIGFGFSDFPLQAMLRGNYSTVWRHDVQQLNPAMANLLFTLMLGTLFAAITGGFIDVWYSILFNCAFAIFAFFGQYFTPKEINRMVEDAESERKIENNTTI